MSGSHTSPKNDKLKEQLLDDLARQYTSLDKRILDLENECPGVKALEEKKKPYASPEEQKEANKKRHLSHNTQWELQISELKDHLREAVFQEGSPLVLQQMPPEYSILIARRAYVEALRNQIFGVSSVPQERMNLIITKAQLQDGAKNLGTGILSRLVANVLNFLHIQSSTQSLGKKATAFFSNQARSTEQKNSPHVSP